MAKNGLIYNFMITCCCVYLFIGLFLFDLGDYFHLGGYLVCLLLKSRCNRLILALFANLDTFHHVCFPGYV